MNNNTLNNTDSIYIHGVFLSILGCGILLRGKSGIGKSEIALELINRGHKLIADDVIKFTRNGNSLIIGAGEKLLKNFISIKNLGILNIKKLFGKHSIKNYHKLDLIIDLMREPEEIISNDFIHGSYSINNILSLEINTLSININSFRHAALLIETSARNLKLKQKGFDAANEFIRRHSKFTNKKEKLCA